MLRIGKIQAQSPFILAPLAGYTDLAFRLLCRSYGAGIVVSEMISCHGLCYRQPKTIALLASHPAERPVSFQLFGADPDYMVKAAEILSEFKPDLIDINMGCPVKKVTKRGAGAALMAKPSLAETIITRIVSKSLVPVTVKIRSGCDENRINGVDFAKMIEASGASAITVHGRTWAQGFTGKADWNIIEMVKKSVSIPVIGNGDIICYQDGLNMIKRTGCDGVMIGRGALGNPWVFQKQGKPSLLPEIVIGAGKHIKLMKAHLPVDRMLGVIKNHIGRYFKAIPGAADIRKSIYGKKSFPELEQFIDSLRGRDNGDSHHLLNR